MYQITLNIDGMMCAMCESHVNDAVRNAFPVKKVTSSHSRGETVILSETAIPEAELRRSLLSSATRSRAMPVFPMRKRDCSTGTERTPMAKRAGGGHLTAACRLCYFGSKPRSMRTRAGWLPASLRPECARRARRAQAPRAARPED